MKLRLDKGSTGSVRKFLTTGFETLFFQNVANSKKQTQERLKKQEKPFGKKSALRVKQRIQTKITIFNLRHLVALQSRVTSSRKFQRNEINIYINKFLTESRLIASTFCISCSKKNFSLLLQFLLQRLDQKSVPLIC